MGSESNSKGGKQTMKNFRKVLALVLVLATLFSFTAMAGAAYKDEADVKFA